MDKRVWYDTEERVIFADLSGLTLTAPLFEQINQAVASLAESLPGPVYMVSNWQDVTLLPEVLPFYGEAASQLLKHPKIAGIVRYNANRLGTRTAIRTQTVNRHLQGSEAFL